MTDPLHTGSCQCGRVTITITAPPLWAARCHCADCRKATGAETSHFAGFDETGITISGDTYTEYESSQGVFRGACSHCHSRLSYRAAKWPGEIHLHIGAIDNAADLAPTGNVMTSEKLPWVRLEDDLVNREGFGG